MGAHTNKSDSKGTNKTPSNNGLKPGESPFISFPPTPLKPEGEPIIARTEDGGYRYMGHIPAWDDIKVDTDSQAYKRAVRDYNVKAVMNSNGEITVKRGGLYARDKTYKNVDAFEKDVKKRIDSSSSFDVSAREGIQQGRISQISAEYFRGVVKNNTSSMAIKKMGESIRQSMADTKARLDVAEKAKRKLGQMVETMKRGGK